MDDNEALVFHAMDRPGKLEITPTKPMNTQRDLSLAYSPGVAVPCLEIEKDPELTGSCVHRLSAHNALYGPVWLRAVC